MMKKYALIATTSALLLAAAVYAAPGEGRMKMDADGNGAITKSESQTRSDKMFAKLDINGDGILNEADRDAKVKQHFAEMDTDKNGSINEAEFIAAHKAMAKHRGGQPDGGMEEGTEGKNHKMRGGKGRGGGGGHAMAMMRDADTNNDQAITREEFSAVSLNRFAKADTNNDGTISVEERKAMRGKHHGPHGNEDPNAPGGEE
jgi:hypothetical protein